MDQGDITVIAQTNFRNRLQKFGIKRDDRRRHVYVIGKTGMGKTQLLENMVIQDIRNGHGVAFVDPHGDTIERILRFIPKERINDVVYFNPADLEFPIAFNVLEKVPFDQRHLVASGLIGVFKKIWADSWGPRLEYVLHNAISALLEYPGSTLLGIMRMLTDKAYRKHVISKVSDPVVKAFWVEEYSKYPDRFQAEAIAPIQNKVGRFLTSALMRNIVGQVSSTINVREVMDKQKIFLINLSKGRIGEDNSNLIGALLITKMQLAAMSRVDIPETTRKDFYLYVDEFQNFATESFAGILSEARKYRLNLILAHQYIAQLINDSNTSVRDAVFGNVGTIATFRVGAADAEFMEPEFMPVLTQEDLVNLPKFQIYIKLMIDGVTSNAFSASTLPPLALPQDSEETTDKVIMVSRERYAKPRQDIEEKIIRWAENKHEDADETMSGFAKLKHTEKRHSDAISTKEPAKVVIAPASTAHLPHHPEGKAAVTTEAVCSLCGKKTLLKFKPDPSRPIYCAECLKKVKMGDVPGIPLIEIAKDVPTVSLSEAIAHHQRKSLSQKSPQNKMRHLVDQKVLNPRQVIQFPDGDK